MVFSSKNGTKWYLHTRKVILPRNKIEAISYYFSKEIKDDYYKGDLPLKYKVFETHSGLPMVKKV